MDKGLEKLLASLAQVDWENTTSGNAKGRQTKLIKARAAVKDDPLTVEQIDAKIAELQAIKEKLLDKEHLAAIEAQNADMLGDSKEKVLKPILEGGRKVSMVVEKDGA